MTKKFLDKVYDVQGLDSTRALYDAWAQSYDDEVGGEGYATPARIADALIERTEPSAPLLDFGCGTGLSGLALSQVGFSCLHGCDMSSGMLEQAHKRGVYDRLMLLDGTPPDKALLAPYATITAVGVISTGAAPASLLGVIVEAMSSGTQLALSYNAHTLADANYMAALDSALARPDVTLVFSEDGPHLPGLDLTSRVMILSRT